MAKESMVKFSVDVPEYIDKDLRKIMRFFNRTKGYLVREAVKEYVLQLKEDIEDYKDIEEFERNQSTSPKSLEKIKRECRLI